MNKDNVRDDFHTKVKNLNVLFQFIKNNKEEQFLEYIANLTVDDVDVNNKDEQGNYLAHTCIIMNSRKMLQKLIEFDTRLDILDTDGYSLLYHPIKFNYTELIDILLESDKKSIGISLVNIKDVRGSVPIFYAIKYRNVRALQELFTHGADANYKNMIN